MKIYKVTYYDGHEKNSYFVRAKSINAAIIRVKDMIRSDNLAGYTILGAERARLSFQISCAAYTKCHPISNPKEIVQIMKNKNIRQLPKRRK